MHRRLIQTEAFEPIVDRITSRLPICPTVDEQDPAVGLDCVSVDPGRALEGERGRDQVDAVAE